MAISRAQALAVGLGVMALASGIAYADSKFKGWVTKVDRAEQTIEVDGRAIPTKGVRVTGGPLEPGAFVSIGGGQVKVKPQRRPADDQLIRYAARAPDNPGRVEFSHIRHFNALGEKQCKTCHSPEMGLVTNPTYASRAATPALEPHGPTSTGRYCAACHNGVTRRSQVGASSAEATGVIFSSLKTGSPKSCHRCHAPADHGRDFTQAHGEIAEHAGGRPCLACHAQDWSARDRRLQSEFLAAQQTLTGNPDDPRAPLVVGPDNFCVYCHRRDAEWR